MSLVLATGSNLGDRKNNLDLARQALAKKFSLIAQSRIYHSQAADYQRQPSFYNQILEFERPRISPSQVMKFLLSLEAQFGRVRSVPKGPRLIDLDIIFWGTQKIELPQLNIPHPRLFERSFVVLPLKEIPFYKVLKKHHTFPSSFSLAACPLPALFPTPTPSSINA